MPTRRDLLKGLFGGAVAAAAGAAGVKLTGVADAAEDVVESTANAAVVPVTEKQRADHLKKVAADLEDQLWSTKSPVVPATNYWTENGGDYDFADPEYHNHPIPKRMREQRELLRNDPVFYSKRTSALNLSFDADQLKEPTPE
jgi:hypothetical protein